MLRLASSSALVLVLILVSASSVQAQVRGISYTFAPEAGRIYFDRNAGLQDDFVYGGGIGFGVGQYVELSAFYLFNPAISRDLSDVTGVEGPIREALLSLPERDVRLNMYGGRLRLNLTSSSLMPFITLGTGVLEFNADELNRSRHIFASAGAGVQLTSSDRYALSIGAENIAYRYNLGATFFDEDDLAMVGLTPQNFGQTLVYNWAARAALKVYLGGMAPGTMTDVDLALQQQLSGGLGGMRLVVEPFYGTVNFNSDLNFAPGQRFGGVFSGIDLGPYVGLRGFYWRAMEDGELAFDDLQAYGGELRLALATGRNLTPYVTLGGGYLDVFDDYEGREGLRPTGEPFVMGGGGIRVPFSDQIQVIGGLRLLLVSTEGVDNFSQPSDIALSTMLTGGIRFSIGGGRDDLPPLAAADVEVDEDPRAAELRRLRERIEELERGDVDTERVVEVQEPAAREEAPAPRSYRSDQMVSIPVPEEGEIYIRYGPPAGTVAEPLPGGGVAYVDTARVRAQSGGLTAGEIQRIVRETVRSELADYEGPTSDAATVARLEQRINTRLNEVMSRIDRMSLRQPSTSSIVVDRTAPSQDRVRIIDGRVSGAGLVAAAPFGGFTAGDATSLNIGIRGDYRSDFLRFLDWHPEFVIGFGTGGYAYNLNLHGVYSLDFLRQVVPYVGVGFGMMGFNEPPEDVSGIQLLFNMVTGAEFDLGGSRVFVEYAAMDFGDFHRLIFGYRVVL